MTDFAAARRKMVDNQLRTGGITDRRLLMAMGQVPRELFVPERLREFAYVDEAPRLTEAAGERYLAAPAPFARLVQLAGIRSEDRVLDVGCATGYSAAVLAHLAGTVVALESDAALAATARANLAVLSLANAAVVEGPLEAGAPLEAPFDVIVVEGTVGKLPPALLGQLAEDGRLVAVEAEGRAAIAHLYVRSRGDVSSRAEFNLSLPPLALSKSPPPFVF